MSLDRSPARRLTAAASDAAPAVEGAAAQPAEAGSLTAARDPQPSPQQSTGDSAGGFAIGRRDTADIDIRLFRVAGGRRTALDPSRPVDLLAIMRAGDDLAFEVDSRAGPVRSLKVQGSPRVICALPASNPGVGSLYLPLSTSVPVTLGAASAAGAVAYQTEFEHAQRVCADHGGIQRIVGPLTLKVGANGRTEGRAELVFGAPN